MNKPTALGSFIFAGGFSLGVSESFDVLAHLEETNYGVATVRRNFPDLPVRVGRDRWPLDALAAGSQIDWIFGNPPCFSPETKILTENGPKKIKDLVRSRSTERVWSVDEITGDLVLKSIVGWHKNRYNGELYDVRVNNWTRGARHPNGSRARATANHKFLTKRGWVAACELLPTDQVCVGQGRPNAAQQALIDGMMLGDATIKKHQAQLVVQQISQGYVDLKRRALEPFVSDHGVEAEGADWGDGCVRKPRAWFYLKTQGWVKKERTRWYHANVKRVPANLQLTPIALAAWYMDDGTIRKSGTWWGNQTGAEIVTAHLCTDNFSEDDIATLITKLADIGVESRRVGKRYSRICVTSKGMKKFVVMIGPYILPEMRHKLPSWAPPYQPELWDLGNPIADWDSVVVSFAKFSTWSNVYCLDVEDTHNFVTYGGVAHNCASWSAAGRTVVSGSDWRTDPRTDCTRQHFALLERLRPRAWAWESVTNAFTLGRELVDELTLKALDLGYSVTYLLHNAMYCGVPQNRYRFFFVATDCAFDVDPLDWTTESVASALRRVNDPGELIDHNCQKYQDLLPLMGNGADLPGSMSLRNVWEQNNPVETRRLNSLGQTVGRPVFTIRRCRPDQPAPVVMHELVHPTEHRAMGVNELKALCGFPSWYEFVGLSDVGQISRGVCPPVGAWLARNVARCLEVNEREAPTVRLIDVSRPPGSTLVLEPPRVQTPASYHIADHGQEVPQVPELVEFEEAAAPVSHPAQLAVPNSGAGSIASLPTPNDGERSGAFIRRLLLTHRYDTAMIVEAVRGSYPLSKAGPSDVAWQRGWLRKNGQEVQQVKAIGATPVLPVVAPTPLHEPQPSRKRESVNPAREFDKTSLRENAHGRWVHRDYAAHFFRWGFAGRFIGRETEVLDVGCGVDCPLIGVLTQPMNNVPKRYVGTDLNNEPRSPPTRLWAKLHWQFNFIERYVELGQFDVITNFEVIEHMRKADGLRLLAGLRECLKPTGRLLLSTPVFNGKAAANHLHEFEIDELREAIEGAGLAVEARYGTFASQHDIKRVATAAELELVQRLSRYYDGEVMACFLAPLYPDASRNNTWLCKRSDAP